MADFLTKLEELAGLVNQSLEQLLPPADTYSPLIHQAVRYSLYAGGKRLRPVMALAASQAVGGVITHVLPAACALELIHTYSLIHDDLPAMDNDDFRRGKPASHRVYGEAIAILAGDALLTLAFKFVSGHVDKQCIPAPRILHVIEEIADAAGIQGMIGGQVMDILTDNTEIDGQTLHYIHRKKTGSLYRAAVRTGAILSGASENELSALTRYAENLGIAFQIKDDILDVEGDQLKLGKLTGSDKKNKKFTYPALFGMESAKESARQAVKEALDALKGFDEHADFLRWLAVYVIRRDS